ncbi:TPA: ash family protein [Escherichia coli]|nr:hypothetical protein [Escherichia coli O55]EHP7928993.1 ash family protein [Escherichia coli]EKP8912281.1 ash family protein [Escherichia coli]MBI0854584.1 hypothetical protein [Escherichia coli]QMI16424.1 ash family protein [Escherichia coli]
MTRHIVRGYIPHAPAKSGVGIGVPDEKGDNRRASVFFVVVCTVTSQWWAVWGRSDPRRFLFPGYANPAQFTTILIGVSSGDDSHRKRIILWLFKSQLKLFPRSPITKSLSLLPSFWHNFMAPKLITSK